MRFTDGSSGQYDLVVGADGVFSSIRKRVFGEAYEPIYVGQGVYRFMTERDPSIDQLHVFVGPKLKAGFIPLSNDSMYLFTTMSYPPHTRIDESKTHIILKEALKDFTAPIVVEVRDRMRSPENVDLASVREHAGAVALVSRPRHSHRRCRPHDDAASDRRRRHGDRGCRHPGGNTRAMQDQSRMHCR